MKSYEMVNEKIEWLTNNIERNKVLIQEQEEDMYLFEYNPYYEHLKNYLELYESTLNFLEPIKADLEVLEIFKKRIKCKDNMGSHGFKNSHKHFSFILYNHLEEQKEDFNKVKQWWEENDNENS